jgi:hypothetical protein
MKLNQLNRGGIAEKAQIKIPNSQEPPKPAGGLLSADIDRRLFAVLENPASGDARPAVKRAGSGD